MFSDTSSTSKSTVATPQPTIHSVDCVCNMEAMVCAVLAEYSLPFFWLRLSLGCVKNSLMILQLSKDCICSELL